MGKWSMRMALLTGAWIAVGCGDSDGSSSEEPAAGSGAMETSGSSGSGGAGETGGAGESGGDASCRSYSAEGDVAIEDQTAQLTCGWDGATLTLDCSFEIGGELFRIERVYASVEDFVREADAIGLVRAKQEIVHEFGADPKTTTYAYDADGLLVSSEEERSEGTLSHTFADHDAEGRPQSGVMSWDTCPGIDLAFAYDDDARTVTTTFMPDGEDCSFGARSDVDTYDEDGTLVRVDEGGTDPRNVFEMTVTKTESICL